MSSNLPSSVVRAMQGDYDVPIKRLWIETWHQLIQMPKTFWQGFGLILLVLFSAAFFVDFFYRWYDIGIIHFQNHQAQLLSLHTLHVLTKLKMLFGNFIVGIIQVLRVLLTVSFAFLALNQIRQQPIKTTLVFVFLKNWQSLVLISVVFYLLTRLTHYGLFFIFKATHLLFPVGLSRGIFVLDFAVQMLLAFLLNTYFMIVAFMAGLLILDQKLTLKTSLSCAFRSINQHWIKNIILMFLANVVYAGILIDLFNIIFAIKSTNYWMLYFFALAAMAPILIISYKKVIPIQNASCIKNLVLALLLIILGLVFFPMFFFGMGNTWFLPAVAVLLAIQYQHIFLDNH